MKATGLLVLAVSICQRPAVAQQIPESKVPAAVRQEWEIRFPMASAAQWQLKSDHNYEAEFKSRGLDRAVRFTPAGAWLETETTIGAITMPDAVRAAVIRRFKGYRIIDTQRLDRALKPVQLFEVHLENAAETIKVQLTPDGAVFSKVAKPRHPDD